METLQYTIIKNKTQYNEYCIELKKLVDNPIKSQDNKDRIELLNLLIKKWDNDHNTFDDLDPIALLEGLMAEKNIKPIDLLTILGLNSKGGISDILNYKKGLSKDSIRRLADYFKVSQEAFNRPYKLKEPTITKSEKLNDKNGKIILKGISVTRKKRRIQ